MIRNILASEVHRDRFRAVGEYMQVDGRILIGGAIQDTSNQPWRERLQQSHRGKCRITHARQLVCVRLATEQQQVLIHRLLYFRIAGQRPTSTHAESLGRLDLGYAIIANALIDDYARRLLGQ